MAEDISNLETDNSNAEFDNSSMDLISSCKEFYVKRVLCLDKFREKLQCLQRVVPLPDTMDESDNVFVSSTTISSKSNRNTFPANPGLSNGLIQLKTDMMSLMEHDITLTSKLISLSEAIADFKREMSSNSNYTPSNSSSMVSLNDLDDNLDNNINRVIVDDYGDDEDDDDINESSFEIPRRDYFARQSSILRIPIPPSRHRSRSYVECAAEMAQEFDTNKGLVDKREQTLFKRQSLPIFGISRNCNSRSVLHSPASDSGVSMESANGTITTDENVTTKLLLANHRSQNSFDSGIHLVSPSDDKKIRVHV